MIISGGFMASYLQSFEQILFIWCACRVNMNHHINDLGVRTSYGIAYIIGN